MHKNTYLDLVLTVCMGVVQESLWAKVKPAPEHSANIHCTCAMTPIEHKLAKLEINQNGYFDRSYFS